MRNFLTVIVGAGPAGLAIAAQLGIDGIPALVIERGDAVGERWRHPYDRFDLQTVRARSSLPRMRIPRRYGRFVSRSNLIEYFEDYASAKQLNIRTNTYVSGLSRAPEDNHNGDQWLVHLDSGETLVAHNVVIATGRAAQPVIPPWPGRENFSGRILHSSEYVDGMQFRGQRVLIIGSENHGAEIATDLAEAGTCEVDLSIKSPPRLVRREMTPFWSTQPSGISVGRLPTTILDLAARLTAWLRIPYLRSVDLPEPQVGHGTRPKQDQAELLWDVGLINAVQTGAVVIKSAVTGFTPHDVIFADSSHGTYDSVIAATGYGLGLEDLVPSELNLLDTSGVPRVHGGRAANPGLYFLGFTITLGSAIREISRESRRVARSIVLTL